ncbi:NADP-dependent phosphogluconate dehydrogenase [Natronospirillum operosum]|uniref:6-phosphogluconate dehydrogenase, decarboxylating n=1 Tax=Natronospirillum operosum TaxID=2759953 RepID=A0A4Z0WDC4_9GAMM|nr:NADP-dependent phosphogluconate dehydrogenase [Natronospirillum operosum]TGG93202.1 NADP-dependent phosphogluconate dehydrogenase [Natronospirillum operosum]
MTDTTQTTPAPPSAGVVGLGVMGRNLALNLAQHGYSVVGQDLQAANGEALRAQAAQEDLPARAVASAAELLAELPAPRILILMVPAGPAVDAVCADLVAAGAGPDDLVIDCGNSDWEDTERRFRELAGKLRFFATGVSGGEEGARHGPSLMASGDAADWQRVKPLWQAIAARAATRSSDDTVDPVCAARVGPGGSGHFVKMVHNGIEYADMQLICEAYHLLRSTLGYAPQRIGTLFAKWNRGPLASYLMEISADILQTADPETGQPLVDVILDRAGQKGTGVWTVINAARLGAPAGLISESVFARALSARKAERQTADRAYNGNRVTAIVQEHTSDIEQNVHDALLAGKLCAYAQGFAMLRQASEAHGWQLDLSAIARIWRGGCVIRADLLDTLRTVLDSPEGQTNLLLHDRIRTDLQALQAGWRSTLKLAIDSSVPTPALSSALAWFDGYCTADSPASLLQAQRDYFGAHTYERKDAEDGVGFHLQWQAQPRRQTRR